MKNSAYNVYIPNSVKRDIKKLDKAAQLSVLDLIREISCFDYIGEKMTGQLCYLYKAKFSSHGVQYRIVYKINDENIEIRVVLVGTRENFYTELKRRL
jgi:mRNA-degrading endonuclease RelE of RelBE toxin-antitoxin system